MIQTERTWVTWEPRGRDAFTNPRSKVAHAADSIASVTDGGFPLACGRFAPDGMDAIISPSSGRRCRRCEKALAAANEAPKLSDEWSDAPTAKIPPLSREQDEAEESYFLASSDVVLGLSARQAGLLADFLSHDMDMITVVAADADESDVQALRLQLERKIVVVISSIAEGRDLLQKALDLEVRLAKEEVEYCILDIKGRLAVIEQSFAADEIVPSISGDVMGSDGQRYDRALLKWREAVVRRERMLALYDKVNDDGGAK